MLLIIVLILSQDDCFNKSIHEVVRESYSIAVVLNVSEDCCMHVRTLYCDIKRRCHGRVGVLYFPLHGVVIVLIEICMCFCTE